MTNFGIIASSMLLWKEEEASPYFIMTWTVPSNSTSITIPKGYGSPFLYDIQWDTGESWEEGLTGDATHDYGAAGTYTVSIRGIYPSIRIKNNSDRLKFSSIENWGTNVWGKNMNDAFQGCENMVDNSEDFPDFSEVEVLLGVFNNCNSFKFNNFPLWKFGSPTTLYAFLRDCYMFDEDISRIDVSNVDNMIYILDGVTLSTSNYDALLIGWSNQNVKSNISFYGGDSKYSPSGKVGRDKLENDFNWDFSDGGPA